MTFSPFLCLNEEIMQCFFVNSAKIVFNSFRYNKSLKPKKERNGNETGKSEAELKDLRLKAKELRKKIEDKQKDEIFSALIASGKTVEEVMTYLKSGNEEKAE